MGYTALTYGTLSLESSEVLNIRWRREFQITSLPTVNLTEITQPGNLTAIDLEVTATIRNNARTAFNNWVALLATKPLETLTLFTTNQGNYYLSSLDISTNELDDVGDILRLEMILTFKQNQNFG
jgi:hypothetical protein